MINDKYTKKLKDKRRRDLLEELGASSFPVKTPKKKEEEEDEEEDEDKLPKADRPVPVSGPN